MTVSLPGYIRYHVVALRQPGHKVAHMFSILLLPANRWMVEGECQMLALRGLDVRLSWSENGAGQVFLF